MESRGGSIMLLYFSVENSYSFSEKAELDMRATSQKDQPGFPIEKGRNRILPVASIYGANASGKTNFMRSMRCFIKNIQLSATFDEDDIFFGLSYAFSSRFSEPTCCEVLLLIDEYEYRYGYSISNSKVHYETLYAKQSGTNQQFKPLFERTDNNTLLYGELKKNKQADVLTEMVKDNKLYLSWIGAQGIPHAQNIYDWCKKVSCHAPMQEFALLEKTKEILYSEPDTGQKIIDFIKSFDTHIDNIEVEKDENLNKNIGYKMYFRHQHEGGGTIRLNSSLESAGTNRVLLVYPSFLSCFNNGGLLVIDELDQNLHPLLLRKLVGLFHDKKINKRGAQLVFASHNLVLLDSQDMRRDEIWFVNKDNQGKSSLYSLAKYREGGKGIRSDRDYGKSYLSGCFDAIPFNTEDDYK